MIELIEKHIIPLILLIIAVCTYYYKYIKPKNIRINATGIQPSSRGEAFLFTIENNTNDNYVMKKIIFHFKNGNITTNDSNLFPNRHFINIDRAFILGEDFRIEVIALNNSGLCGIVVPDEYIKEFRSGNYIPCYIDKLDYHHYEDNWLNMLKKIGRIVR